MSVFDATVSSELLVKVRRTVCLIGWSVTELEGGYDVHTAECALGVQGGELSPQRNSSVDSLSLICHCLHTLTHSKR